MNNSLKQSKDLFKVLFESNPVPTIITTRDGVIKRINLAFTEVTGFGENDIVGQTSVGVGFWRSQEERERIVAMILERGEIKNQIVHFFRKDGSPLQCLTSSRPIVIDGENHFLNTIVDVTEQRQTNKRLQKSEALFHEFFHLNPIASIVSDSSGMIHMANPAFLKASGLSNDEVVGKTSQELGFWKNNEDRERMLRAVREKGYINNLETHFYRKGGKLLTCLLSSRAIKYGDEVRILNVLVDVTKQRNAEENLRKSEQLFRAFFETNPIATIISSADGKIHKVNPEFQRTTGFSSQEVVGRTVREMNFWRDPTDRGRMVAAVEEHGFLDHFESNFFGKNDTPMTCLISSRAINHEGEVRILSTVFDITEQRKAEESIKKLEQAKRDFISIAAHELRTPLIAIIGYCELLENSAKTQLSEDTKNNYLEIIQTNAEVLNCLVNDLLDMGRIQVGRSLGIYKRDTEIVPLVKKVVSSANLKSSLHEVVFNEKDNVPITINADSGRVTQVLHNLLNNAIKFSPEGGVITVTLKGIEDFVCISVSDQGIGMPPEEAEKIFEQHYRIDSESTKTQGLGLGLSIVKQIVEDHSGTVEVDSTPGKGTTVTVSIPVK